MKLDIKKMGFNEDCFKYKIINHKKCCDELINCNSVVLLEGHDENTSKYEYSVKIRDTQVWSDPWEKERGDSSVDSYYTITSCPFCQSSIEINIVEEIDINDEYFKLKEERDYKNKQRRNIDSKKKERILDQEIRILDDKINEFYYSDGLEIVREVN